MCIRDRNNYEQSGKAIKRCCEETEESVKKIRRELIVDDQMEVKELPEDENTEQVSPKLKDNGIKNQVIKEKEEVKMEERRTMRPKKTRVTKELIEMTRGGLINMINLPITNHEDRVFRKEYRRSIICLLYTSRCV